MRDSDASELRIVVIGAGMAGILSGIKLREAGFTNVAIYENGDGVGGTWHENTYPGLTCDVPSHSYTYSFESNPDWSHRFSPGDEIEGYFEKIACKYGVDELITFGREIAHCEWVNGRWHLETKSGRRDEADFVIAATGVLHHPSYPDIVGLEDFKGALFHSARWDHDVPLDGRRIGVIGTGSTGVQIVSALAGRAGKLCLFQRTAQWIMPIENPAYTEEEKAEFHRNPELLRRMHHESISGDAFTEITDAFVDADSAGMKKVEMAVLANLENSVKDPELREKLRPSYRAACKRLVLSPDFYEAIQRPSCELVTVPIERVEERGVRTRDGELHELDVLVLATGFKADRFMRPMELIGRDGVKLETVWARRPAAYLAISIPGFPNFFMLNGPNGPVGNSSLIDVAERQWHYIAQLIELVRAGRCREICATQNAMEVFEAARIDAAKKTIWATGCRSWYLDADGVPASWPWRYECFREAMEKPGLHAYEQR